MESNGRFRSVLNSKTDIQKIALKLLHFRQVTFLTKVGKKPTDKWNYPSDIVSEKNTNYKKNCVGMVRFKKLV